MEKAKIVLDASVIVKWFNVEEYSEVALEIKRLYVEGLIDIVAPELLFYEVGNALKYNPNFGEKDVKRALKALEDMQIELKALRGELISETIKVAFRHGLTLYDASYVALANLSNTICYTVDEEVIERISKENVKHLREFKFK